MDLEKEIQLLKEKLSLLEAIKKIQDELLAKEVTKIVPYIPYPYPIYPPFVYPCPQVTYWTKTIVDTENICEMSCPASTDKSIPFTSYYQ